MKELWATVFFCVSKWGFDNYNCFEMKPIPSIWGTGFVYRFATCLRVLKMLKQWKIAFFVDKQQLDWSWMVHKNVNAFWILKIFLHRVFKIANYLNTFFMRSHINLKNYSFEKLFIWKTIHLIKLHYYPSIMPHFHTKVLLCLTLPNFFIIFKPFHHPFCILVAICLRANWMLSWVCFFLVAGHKQTNKP